MSACVTPMSSEQRIKEALISSYTHSAKTGCIYYCSRVVQLLEMDEKDPYSIADRECKELYGPKGCPYASYYNLDPKATNRAVVSPSGIRVYRGSENILTITK